MTLPVTMLSIMIFIMMTLFTLTLGPKILNIMVFSRMTLMIIILGKMILIIMTLGITTFGLNYTQHNGIQHNDT